MDFPVSPRLRMAAGNVFAVAAVVSVVIVAVNLMNTWMWTSDGGYIGEDGQTLSRWHTFAQSVYYGDVQVSAIGLLAVIMLLWLAGAAAARSVPLSWRRTVVLVAVGATAGSILLSALVLAVSVWGALLVPADIQEAYFGDPTWQSTVLQLIRPLVAVLAWSAVLVLGIGCWPREEIVPGEGDLDDDQVDELLAHGTVAHPQGADYRRPGDDAATHPAAEAPVLGRDPARLRSDGSSDTGYDEFRFRR